MQGMLNHRVRNTDILEPMLAALGVPKQPTIRSSNRSLCNYTRVIERDPECLVLQGI